MANLHLTEKEVRLQKEMAQLSQQFSYHMAQGAKYIKAIHETYNKIAEAGKEKAEKSKIIS